VTKDQSDIEIPREPAQEVERIRDIIFGAQMKDYEGRFQTVRRDLDRLQAEIDRLNERLAEQAGDQSKKVRDLRQEMRRADDDMRDELRESAQRLTADKVDRTVLGELFTQLGGQVKTGGSLTDMLAELGEPEQD
jgi:predicted  nucleic acid-binding Zn-ribbon protein